MPAGSLLVASVYCCPSRVNSPWAIRLPKRPTEAPRYAAELFAQQCGYEANAIEIEPDLYFLGSGSIEAVILAQDDRLERLMLVFHNPDITHFANSIDYEFHVDNIPTCGLIKLSCDIAQWRDWSLGNTGFDYFDFPKNDAEVVQCSSSPENS